MQILFADFCEKICVYRRKGIPLPHLKDACYLSPFQNLQL